MDRYVNFSPELLAPESSVVDGPVAKEKPRIRVARSPSDVGESAAARARAHTDLSDSSVNNTAEDLGKKGSNFNRSDHGLRSDYRSYNNCFKSLRSIPN